MEQTNVTNSAVSGSAQQSLNPSGEGKNPLNEKEIENRIRENLRGEYDRKTESLAEKLTESEERMAELESQIELSKSQRDELRGLKDDRGEAEEQLRILETDPKYRPYVTKIQREGERFKESAKSEAKNEVMVEFMKDYIRDQAEKEGIKFETLYNELNERASDGRYGTLNPLQKAKQLYRDRSKDIEFAKREADLKKREEAINGFSEDGQRQARDKSYAELEAEGDTVAMAKKLGL